MENCESITASRRACRTVRRQCRTACAWRAPFRQRPEWYILFGLFNDGVPNGEDKGRRRGRDSGPRTRNEDGAEDCRCEDGESQGGDCKGGGQAGRDGQG